MKYPLDPRSLFEGVPTTAPILVAVSGGSDSIALLHLASIWARAVDADLRVVTVDHGLRPEAAAEAGFVAGVCEGLGWPHFTLAWEGVKPQSGISESARNARYNLLAEFAEDCGARAILTGHTQDDQAETVWMRNSRNLDSADYRGLAGMASTMTLLDQITVYRPLLQISRQELRVYLGRIGQTWIEDPSNFDMAYERVRARSALQVSDVPIETIARFATACGRLRRIDCELAASQLRKTLMVGEGPVYRLVVDAFGKVPLETALLMVRVVLAMAGGGRFLVPRDQAEAIMAMKTGDRMTAGHCIAEQSGKELVIYRECRNLPLVSIEPGETGFWDNRLLIENRSRGLVICRAAEPDELKRMQETTTWKAAFRPKAVGRSLPLIQDYRGDIMLPFTKSGYSIQGIYWRMICPAIEEFRPGHDDALAGLLGDIREKIEPVGSC